MVGDLEFLAGSLVLDRQLRWGIGLARFVHHVCVRRAHVFAHVLAEFEPPQDRFQIREGS